MNSRRALWIVRLLAIVVAIALGIFYVVRKGLSFEIIEFLVGLLGLVVLTVESWERIGKLLQRRRQRVRENEIARGHSGLLSQLALYRERLIPQLIEPVSLGQLGPFSLEKMYVPLPIALGTDEEQLRTLGDPESLLREHQRLAVLGRAGAGKTTLLRHLALQSAKQRLRGLPDIPVLVSLGEFAGSRDHDFVRFVAYKWENQAHIYISQKALEKLFAEGLILLLLDGLDEVGIYSSMHPKVVGAIYDLVTAYPALPIVLTSRTAYWTGQVSQFQEAVMPPLTHDTIRKIVTARFTSQPFEAIERFCLSVEANKYLEDMATNPLMLSLMMALFEKELRLPENRAKLYEAASDLLVYQWDIIKKTEQELLFPQHLKYRFLEKLGLVLQHKEITHIAVDEVNHIVPSVVTELHGSQSSREFVKEIITAHGLLARKDHYLSFTHLAFQHYFAALEIRGQSRPEKYLSQYFGDPWWREPVVLVAAMGYASTLVEMILDEMMMKEMRAEAKFARLSLAAECIVESRGVKDEFRQEVLHKLAYVFRYGIEQATRQAGRLLVRTDPRFAKDFLLQLVNDEQAILSRRQQAALVLSELLRDHPRVIELLVDALKSPESDIRADAARALGRLESGTFLEPLTSSLETDGSPKVRMELLRAIEQITQSTTIDTSTQAVGFKAVRESHQDPDPGVRELAIEITGRLRAKFQ